MRLHRRALPSTAAAIGEASTWLRGLASAHGLDEATSFHLDLCANELMDNVAEHAYPGTVGEIVLELELDQATATLTVIDAGPPFDPLTQPAPPRPSSLQDSPDGGLGLHLVRRFAESLHYDRSDGRNRYTVRIDVRVPPAIPPDSDLRAGSAVAPTLHETAAALTAQDKAGIGLFRGIPARDLDAVLAQCRLRRCSAGEILLRAGERHESVLVPLDRNLEVHLDRPDSPFHVDVLPGECVGELSIIDGKPISAWVVAAAAGRLLLIPDAVFLGPVLALPGVARNLLATQSERMRHGNDQIIARTRAALELEALQRELDLARQIQMSMLPAAPLFPVGDRLDGCGFMRAARQVGGDFYDAFTLDEGRYFIAIGDVCNKGMAAALFMVRSLLLLRTEALRPAADLDQRLARLVSRCNDLLHQANDAQQFVTLFCAIVDVPGERLHFVNGGHNRPLLMLPAAAPRFVNGPRNPIVGMVPGLRYAAGNCAFPMHSLLLLYTDGVTEADRADGRLFGDDALLHLLTDSAGMTAEACVERVVTAIDAFASEHPQSDDITLLAVRRL